MTKIVTKLSNLSELKEIVSNMDNVSVAVINKEDNKFNIETASIENLKNKISSIRNNSETINDSAQKNTITVKK